MTQKSPTAPERRSAIRRPTPEIPDESVREQAVGEAIRPRVDPRTKRSIRLSGPIPPPAEVKPEGQRKLRVYR